MSFEQGPIRPPSESRSLLVRVSRNCPWNRCAFCPVYKGTQFSLRSVDEVLADLKKMKAFYVHKPETVFLQDADPLVIGTEKLVRIVESIRRVFPEVRRITAYARSHTLARCTLEDLRKLRQAGLDRLHVGLESGAQVVLDQICKGVSREKQLEGGRKAKEAGFELSAYVMPGIGGKDYSNVHATETASALCAIQPDFIRLRTTVVVPGTPLAELAAAGVFIPLSEIEIVGEIRSFLSRLHSIETRLESDHSLNLLMELKGNLPSTLDSVIDLCDRFMALPESEQNLFVIGRRTGRMWKLVHLKDPERHEEVEELMDSLAEDETDGLEIAEKLRLRLI